MQETRWNIFYPFVAKLYCCLKIYEKEAEEGPFKKQLNQLFQFKPRSMYTGHLFQHLTVQLDVVDIPAGEGVGIDVHVADDARISGAGKVAVVLVDAELHAFAMNL